MKVNVDLRSNGIGFDLTYAAGAESKSLKLGRSDTQPGWPIPSPANARVQQLIDTATGLAKAYAYFVDRAPAANHGAFAEYLGAVLLGGVEPNWLEAADGLQLELSVTSDDPLLAALPWELAQHDALGFLARTSRFSLVRIVKGATSKPYSARVPAVVLFVIGADLLDPRVRPAAEFLCVLRAVPGLRSHLLINATPARLARAVRTLRPTVVHLIAHGDRDPPTLYLRGNDGVATEAVTPELLLEHLTVPAVGAPGALPPIVILNACHSAAAGVATADSQFSSSFALHLVKGGVGTVVAMAGEVSDQASRLFARRMYESLADGNDWVAATSHARRFALLQENEPHLTTDWALPTILVPENGRSLHAPLPEDQKQWQQRAANLAKGVTYPPFCDRWALWETFERMLSPTELQSESGGEVRAIVIETANGEHAGKTAACEELRSCALHHGHLPLRVDAKVTIDPADRMQRLWELVELEWQNVVAELGVQQVALQKPATPDTVCTWLQACIAAVEKDYPGAAKDAYCILLIDNAHDLSGAMDTLLKEYLIPAKLLGPKSRIRVVFTYAHATGRELSSSALKDWRDRLRPAASFKLSHRVDDQERDLVYDHFLFRYSVSENGNHVSRPLVASNAAGRTLARKILHQWVAGELPSFISQEIPVRAALDAIALAGVLRRPNDEEVIANYKKEFP